MIRTLKCIFDSSPYKRYSYIYDGDEIVEPGDLAVVDSPYGGPTLVTIKDVDYGNSYGPCAKKVLAVVSMAHKRQAERKAELERRLKQKLQSPQAQLLMFAQLAKVDDEAAKLFEELKRLGT